MSGPTVKVNTLLLTYPRCEEGILWLKEHLLGKENLSLWVIGEETHKDECKHLHALIKLRSPRNFRSKKLNSHFDFDGHHPNIEFVKATRADLIRVYKYVTKEGHYEKFGIDIKTLEAGKTKSVSAKELMTTNPNTLVDEGLLSPYQYTNIVRAQAIYKLYERPEDEKDTRGIWLYGRPGCGKSTAAQEFGKTLGGFYLKTQNKWWDGYYGEPVVILDDLDTSTLNHYLKIWTDKWACKAEIKGATIWCRHKWFIVTSNNTLEEICSRRVGEDQGPYMVAAMKRRFIVIAQDEIEEEYFTKDTIQKYIDKRYEKDPMAAEPSLLEQLSGSGFY